MQHGGPHRTTARTCIACKGIKAHGPAAADRCCAAGGEAAEVPVPVEAGTAGAAAEAVQAQQGLRTGTLDEAALAAAVAAELKVASDEVQTEYSAPLSFTAEHCG